MAGRVKVSACGRLLGIPHDKAGGAAHKPDVANRDISLAQVVEERQSKHI
jgi:hypothetical protein